MAMFTIDRARSPSPAFRQRGRGLGQQVDPGAPGDLFRVGDAIPQLDRPFAHRRGSTVRVREARFFHRLERCDEGTTDVMSGHPVIRDLARRPRAAPAAFERLGVAGVEACALPGKEVGVDRLTHQGVPERVFVVVGGEHVGGHRFARGGVELLGRSREHRGEEFVIDAAATR